MTTTPDQLASASATRSASPDPIRKLYFCVQLRENVSAYVTVSYTEVWIDGWGLTDHRLMIEKIKFNEAAQSISGQRVADEFVLDLLTTSKRVDIGKPIEPKPAWADSIEEETNSHSDRRRATDWNRVTAALDDHYGAFDSRIEDIKRLIGPFLGQPEPGSIPAAKVREAVAWFLKKQSTSGEERNGIRKFCNELGLNLNEKPESKNPELLPCPMCGGAAEIVDEGWPTVRCKNRDACSVQLISITKDKAEARWNRRDGTPGIL